MKILKIKTLTILGLVMITALVVTTFAVYSYAAPTRFRAVDEEYGEMHDEHYEMHEECMEMMDETHGEDQNSTMHNKTEESHHLHHGCH